MQAFCFLLRRPDYAGVQLQPRHAELTFTLLSMSDGFRITPEVVIKSLLATFEFQVKTIVGLEWIERLWPGL